MNVLERIVALSVRRRGAVLIVWLLIAITAALATRKLSIDAVPDVTNTQVSILTASPGLSPAEVEQYLTFPIETAMNGLPGVIEIRSLSRTAVSSVNVIFDEDTHLWFARQLVSERLKLAEAEIPPGYGRPELAPPSTGLGEIYEFYLTNAATAPGRHSPMELRTLLDWVVAYRLRSVKGVVEVNGMGGDARQYQVVVDAQRMAAYHLSLGRIHAVLSHNNASVGGGYIERGAESFVIRADGQLKTIADIESTVVASDRDGTPVLLKQVATVRLGPALRFGTVTRLGEGEIVAGTVMMLIGANSREVVHAVKAKLAEIQKELPEGVEIRSYYDRAEFIDRMLQTVAANLGEGALLVVGVLLLTLGSLRGSLVAGLAIPMAMAVALLGMVQLGVTGNLMSLGAIDFGLLVDGAIVMLEATLAALALHRPADREGVIAQVSLSMRRTARPVTFSLAIILLVYLPLMALEGVEGKMFKPMAVTVALALAGALAFSLTAFPAMAAYALRTPPEAHGRAHRIFVALQEQYRRVIDLSRRRAAWIVGGAVGAVAIAGGIGMQLGAEFVPRLDEGELSLDIRRLPSISITEAQRLGGQVEAVLGRFPEVLSVVTRTGRAEVATDPVGPDETEVMVKLRPRTEWTSAHDLDGLGEKIKAAVESEVPATFVSVSQPIEDRVNQLLAGSRADVVVKVFGDDLLAVKSTADRVGAVLRDVPGAGDWRVQRVLGLPLIEVKPNRTRLSRYGINADQVLDVVEASRVGRYVGKVFEGQRRFDLVLLLPPATLTPEGLGELLVESPAGNLIPLAQVADIRETEGPAVINREALERRVLAEVNVRGRDLVGFVGEARQRVEAEVRLPAGVHLEWGGQFENFTRASQRLGLVAPMALAIIFGMLFLMFGDVRVSFAVFAGVPLAVVGGVLSLATRGLPFSIPAAVGFIAVAGVAVLNGVVMAGEVVRRLPDEGLDRALRDGMAAMLRPVLTTALVAAIGFLPMALSTRAGAEVQRPLATVVIGGIVSSTLLSLAVLPALLHLMLRRSKEARSPVVAAGPATAPQPTLPSPLDEARPLD